MPVCTNSKCKHHGHIVSTGLVVTLWQELQGNVSINAVHFQTFYLPLHLHKFQHRPGYAYCSVREKSRNSTVFLVLNTIENTYSD